MHWLERHRWLILGANSAFWTAIVVSLHFFAHGVPFFSTVWRGQQSFEDLLRREGRRTAKHPDFVFVSLDQTTLSFAPFDAAQLQNNRALQLMTQRPFPWSREVWALLLDRLFGAGARLVMFDMMFDRPSEGDPTFRAALDRYREKVVIAENFDYSNMQETGPVAKKVLPNESLIPPPQTEDDRVGYVVFFNDSIDQKIRSVRYTITDYQLAGMAPRSEEKPHESLSARALEKLGHAADVPRDLQAHLIRFSPTDAYLPHPLWEVFDPAIWRANYNDGKFFKNKIVMIGSSAQIQHDFVDTPISPETQGPVLHLHALAAALDHEFLRPMAVALGFAMICIAGFLSWLVAVYIDRPFITILTLVGISAAYLGLSRVLYDEWGILTIVVPTLTAFLLSGVFGLAFEYALEQVEKLRTRRTLERYVSKNLVKEILENPAGFYSSMRGTRKPVTILFADLVGFTTLSEKEDPAALVAQLNKYLSRMVAVVFNHGGTLDKFIGDAIMAVWGNVSSRGVAEDTKAAVRAALEMRHELKKLNESWRAEGIHQLAFGIGINQGEVLIGNIGSYEPHERLDPTVIGDAVNIASRLEGLTRAYEVDVLLGPSVAEHARDEFYLRTVGRAQAKGKTEAVDVYTLIGARSDAVDPEFLKWLEVYEDAIQQFRKRRFTESKILFSRFLEFFPEDSLAKMYLARALQFEQTPPDQAWNAVEVFTIK
jgi:adenylate cyclase